MSISKKRSKPLSRRGKILKTRRASEKIDYSDIPATDAAFWAGAELRIPMGKQGVFLRIDAEVIDWFKRQGKGYQTRMNAVLRTYVEAHKGRSAR